MDKRTTDIAEPGKIQRDSDNPIVEEYKDDLRSLPGYGARPGGADDARLRSLEARIEQIQKSIRDLSERLSALEAKR